MISPILARRLGIPPTQSQSSGNTPYEICKIFAVRYQDRVVECQLTDFRGKFLGGEPPGWYSFALDIQGLMASFGLPQPGEHAILFRMGDKGIVFPAQNRREVPPEGFDLGSVAGQGLPGENLDLLFGVPV